MVVGTVGVFGNLKATSIAQSLLRIIIVKYGNNGFCAFCQQARVVTFFLVSGQVAHFAFAVALKPLLDVDRLFLQGRRLGNATSIEAQTFGFLDNPF